MAERKDLRPLSKSEKSIKKFHSESFLLVAVLCTSILILSNGFIINFAVDALEHHHIGKRMASLYSHRCAGDPETRDPHFYNVYNEILFEHFFSIFALVFSSPDYVE